MARQRAQWQAEEARKLRPTLLIGIGGSGKDVLLRIRRLFYERMGKSADGTIGYPLIGFLAIDMDPNSPNVVEGEDPKGNLLRNIQFRRGGLPEFLYCPLREPDISRYLSGGRNQFPHIFRWLRREALEHVNLTGHGAGQNRQVARLAFFHYFQGTPDHPGIRPTLEAHIQRVLDAARRPEQMHSWRTGSVQVAPDELNVILIYSLAGGTGAGMFLDMGMLVSELVKERNLEELNVQLTHYVVLPEPFLSTPPGGGQGVQLSDDEKRKIQENTYAALREMEYLAMGQDESFDLSIPPRPEGNGAIEEFPPLYRVRWEANGRDYELRDAPWHICYLVGGSNDRLPSTVAPRDLFQMIAEFIFLDFDPNQFGDRRRMRWPNIMDRLQTTAATRVKGAGGQALYDHVVSRRYSTLGLSKIYFDRARMRRAASYRLAVTLLDHWMRDLNLATSARRQYAEADILEGQLLPGEREAPVALQLEGIRDLLLLKDRKSDRTHTWRHDVQEDELKLRSRVMDGDAGLDDVDDWEKKHHEQMRRHSYGGKEGVAREGIMANCRTAKEEIEARLRRLFLYRVDELGALEARLLLAEYAELLQEEASAADELTRADVSLEPLWRERIEEASRLPDWPFLLRPARHAVRAELLRGLHKVSENLRHRYSFAASEEIRECMQTAAARVGRPGASASEARGSYLNLLERFQTLQGRTRDYLEGQFGELQKDDRTQHRTWGLLDHWDAKKYNEEIELFLRRGGIERDLLKQVEGRVLAQMREQKGQEQSGRWQHVDSLGALISELLPLDRSPEDAGPAVEEFARDLAGACWVLLDGFCNERSALQLFHANDKSKQAMLDMLRVYSAPFLRSSANASLAVGAHTNTLLQLGIADHTGEKAQQFMAELIGKEGGQDLTATQPFSTPSDSIIFCQEKHGLPLLYYHFLEDMARLYYQSPHQPKRHFDFTFLQDRLPDIRMVSFDKQKNLGNCLELTLQGIITGVLTWHDGQFNLSYSSSRYAPRQLVAQGARLENIIHRYAESAAEREELTRQVNEWLRGARQGEGSQLALLWCSLEDLVVEVNARVELLRRKSEVPGAAHRQHPLVAILCHDGEEGKGLLPRLREQLAGLGGGGPGGARWLNSKIDRLHLAETLPGPRLPAALEERERLLAPCYQPYEPSGLPIRVIRPDALLRSADVQFSANEVARPPRVPAGHGESANNDGVR